MSLTAFWAGTGDELTKLRSFCAACQRRILAQTALHRQTPLGHPPSAAQTVGLTRPPLLIATALARIPSHQAHPAAHRCVPGMPAGSFRGWYHHHGIHGKVSQYHSPNGPCNHVPGYPPGKVLEHVLPTPMRPSGTLLLSSCFYNFVRSILKQCLMQSAQTSSNPFGPTSAGSNGGSGYEGSTFGQNQNGFRSQEYGSQPSGIVQSAELPLLKGSTLLSLVPRQMLRPYFSWCCHAGALPGHSCSCGAHLIGVSLVCRRSAQIPGRRKLSSRPQPWRCP